MCPRWPILGLLALFMLAEQGCVNRRLTIRTEPAGALVEVDGERLGLSPVSMDFTYYGTREIVLSKPGYETVKSLDPVPTPWYQWFPIDFFADNLSPFQTTDRHSKFYQMRPRNPQQDEEIPLIDRGNNFRSQAQMGNR